MDDKDLGGRPSKFSPEVCQTSVSETQSSPNTDAAPPTTEPVAESGSVIALEQRRSEEKSRGGRSSTFTREIGQDIIANIRTGKSIPVAAKEEGVPKSTVYDWLSEGECAVDGPLKEFVVGVRKAEADAENADAPPIMEARPLGRPAHCVREVWQPIVDLVRLGNTLAMAAESVDVPLSTIRDWRKRGRREADGPYREFFVALRKARVGLAIRSNALLNRAANAGNVQAAKYLHQLAGGRALTQYAEEEEVPPFEIPEFPEEPEE